MEAPWGGVRSIIAQRSPWSPLAEEASACASPLRVVWGVRKCDALVYLAEGEAGANGGKDERGVEAAPRGEGPLVGRRPVVVVQRRTLLRDQHIVLEGGQPVAIAVELLAPVKGFRGRRQHFEEDGGIQEHIAGLVMVLPRATDDHQVRVRIEALAGMRPV